MTKDSENLRRGIDLLLEYLESPANKNTPHSPFEFEELHSQVSLTINEAGLPFTELLEQLKRILALAPRTNGDRFWNQLYGPLDKTALIAELLANATNCSMYTFKSSGIFTAIEQEVLRYLLDLTGFSNGYGIFTPGGSLSNMTAILLARQAQLSIYKHQILGSLCIYCSEDAHFSIDRAAIILGFNRSLLRKIPSNSKGKLETERLRDAIQEDQGRGLIPCVCVATAGTTVRGSFDNIREISNICKDSTIWLHVDGAYGGAAIFSSSRTNLLDGIELADSFSWDAHKIGGVALTCSVFMTSHQNLLKETLDVQADYLFQLHQDHNAGRYSLQCGRRNDALKLWTLLKHYGEDGLRKHIDHLFHLVGFAASIIRDHPCCELAEEPPFLNLCFSIQKIDSTQFAKFLDQRGTLKLGFGMIEGKAYLRLPIVNFHLREADIQAFFRLLFKEAAQFKEHHLRFKTSDSFSKLPRDSGNTSVSGIANRDQ